MYNRNISRYNQLTNMDDNKIVVEGEEVVKTPEVAAETTEVVEGAAAAETAE
jgi:hypothetical protein